MTQKPFVLVTLLVAALVAAAVPAFAQTQPTPRPGRPSRSLFGNAAQNLSQRLTLNVSFGAGHDQDLAEETPGTGVVIGAAPRPRSGQFGSGSARLSYGLERGAISAGLGIGAHARYYSASSDPIIGTYSGNGDLAVTLGKRTTVSTSFHAGLFRQSLALVNSGALGSGNEFASPLDPTALIDTATYQNVRATAQVNHQVFSRLTVNGSYSYYTNNVYASIGPGRYAAQSATGGVTYQILKGVGLRLGYTFTDAALGPSAAGQYAGRNFDGGINFSRELSLTRRTTLTFSTGATGVTDASGSVRYFATGQASFGHEIGRSWNLSLSGGRNADFFHALGQPVMMDTLGGGVSGQLGRRLQLSSHVAVVRGTALTSSVSSKFSSANAGVGLQVSVFRSLAVNVSYTYYRYQFDDSLLLPPGVLSQLDRQSIRVSLNVWAPLLMRARRN